MEQKLGFLSILVGLIHVVFCRQIQESISYQIPEELSVGTVIGDLKNAAGLHDIYEDAIVKMLQYDFLSPKGTYESYFKIDHNTGIFKVAKTIDREAICPYMPLCDITVDIVVQPFRYFQIIKTIIKILDINDNPPTFPTTNFQLMISETAEVGGKFPLPVADDKDSPRNGIVDYQLQTSRKFQLVETRNEAGETRLHLILQEKLDREVESRYQLRVIAEDGGVSPKRGILLVTVHVGDQNDNSPRFDNATYRVSVSESTQVRAVILQVHARDPDVGLNGELVYSFSQKTASSFGETFGINNQTGQIYLKEALDFEKKHKYHLSVLARDKSENPYFGYSDVVIMVQDVNDHAPVIKVNTFTSSGTAKVSEWAKKEEFVAHISITDDDSGMNGRFTCSVSDSLFALQHIYQNKYKLLTTGTFDRETQAIYNVTIECRDRGIPQLYSSTSILVTIVDKNDNYPKFTKTPNYKAEILENNDISADIIRVRAIDNDLKMNGKVKYKTDLESSKFVSINEDTGLITARAVFDYEQKHDFQIPVIAYDQGIPSKSSTTTVHLKVVNRNDETPVFCSAKYMFGVEENQPVNTLVGTLSATDADEPPYNKLAFSLYSQRDDANSFYINPNTGHIKTRRMLDREFQDTYYLTAIVRNNGFVPPLSSTASVTIHVSDQNDNVPIVDFPNPANYSVRVSGDIPVGYEITKIKAHDDDLKANKKLSFYIIEQSETEMVTIDPWTGVITANKIPSFKENQRHVKLKIQVKDNGTPQNSVETNLDIVMDKSIPFIPPPEPVLESIFSESNAFIWILSGVISISILVILVLVTAIICVKRRRQNNRLARYGYYSGSKMEVKTGSLGHDRVWKFENQDQPAYLSSPNKARSIATTPQQPQQQPAHSVTTGDNSAILYYQMQNQANAASSLARAGVAPVPKEGGHREGQRHEGDYQVSTA